MLLETTDPAALPTKLKTCQQVHLLEGGRDMFGSNQQVEPHTLDGLNYCPVVFPPRVLEDGLVIRTSRIVAVLVPPPPAGRSA